MNSVLMVLKDHKSKLIFIIVFTLLLCILFGCNNASNTAVIGKDGDGYYFSISQKVEFDNLIVKIYHLDNYKWMEVSSKSYSNKIRDLAIVLDIDDTNFEFYYYHKQIDAKEDVALEKINFKYPKENDNSDVYGYQVSANKSFNIESNKEYYIWLFNSDKEDKDFNGGIKNLNLNDEYYADEGYLLTVMIK